MHLAINSFLSVRGSSLFFSGLLLLFPVLVDVKLIHMKRSVRECPVNPVVPTEKEPRIYLYFLPLYTSSTALFQSLFSITFS